MSEPIKSQKMQSVIETSQSAQSIMSTNCSINVVEIYPIFLFLTTLTLQMKDFLRCHWRSMPPWEAKTKTKTPLRVQKLGWMFSTSGKCRVTKRKRWKISVGNSLPLFSRNSKIGRSQIRTRNINIMWTADIQMKWRCDHRSCDCDLSNHAGHASPKKHRVVYNFLSFYSVILKLRSEKELVIL